jgi:hypothetical protein
MKFTSNAFVPSSKIEIKENTKKLSYHHNQTLIMDDLDILNKHPPPSTPPESSGETLS